MITTSSRWQNKVVDAPSPFRSIDESHRRHVSTSHKFSSDLLPGPAVTPRMDHSTPTRRAPGLFQSPPSSRTTQQQHRNSATLGMVENMSLNLSASERREKYSLRMVSPRRSPSVEGVTSIGENEASSALYSKRMSPMRSHSTTSERPLSAANTDVVMDRGRLHSHAHRNYNDTIGAQWTPTRATSNSGSNGMTPVSSSNSVCGTPNSSARVTRPVLKNAESARTEAGHWKPFISKRVTTSTPTLVGVMKPEAITPASPYRLVPPFGVS